MIQALKDLKVNMEIQVRKVNKEFLVLPQMVFVEIQEIKESKASKENKVILDQEDYKVNKVSKASQVQKEIEVILEGKAILVDKEFKVSELKEIQDLAVKMVQGVFKGILDPKGCKANRVFKVALDLKVTPGQ